MRSLSIRLFILLGLIFPALASAVTLPNYSDSWWNANESGWGITITDHDTNAFVQWYTYDQYGHNQKYVISGGTFSSDKCLFSGNISHVTGPSWTASTFDPNQVNRATTGTGTINFCPSGLPTGTIVFNYNNVDGVSGSKQLTRLAFGNDVPHRGGVANTGAADFTDLWWNSNESGWGVSVTQHGNNLFFRVFVYDTDGRPLLFIVPGVTYNSATSFTGNVTLTTGPWFGNILFDPNQVARTTAGTATLTFSDANNGVLSYTVNGVTKTKTITRLEFAAPVANVAPVANAGIAQSVMAGTAVTLDGSASSDTNGDTLTFAWTLTKPAGSAATLALATSAKPSFTADMAGTYVVSLIVNDGKVNSAAATVTVTATCPASYVVQYGICMASCTPPLVTKNGYCTLASPNTDLFQAFANNVFTGGYRTVYTSAIDGSTRSVGYGCGYSDPYPDRATMEARVQELGGTVTKSTLTEWCANVSGEIGCLERIDNNYVEDFVTSQDHSISFHMVGLVAGHKTTVNFDTLSKIATVESQTKDTSITSGTCNYSSQPNQVKESINGNWIGYKATYTPSTKTGATVAAEVSCVNQVCTILDSSVITVTLSDFMNSTGSWLTASGAPKFAGASISADRQLLSMFVCNAPLDESKTFENCSFYSFKH